MSSRRGATGARSPQNLHDADEELDLPPLDGALDDGERPVGALDEDDEIEEGEPAAGDDRAATDLDPGFALDVTEEPAIEGGEAARDAIDVGAIADEIAFFDDAARDSDESGLSRDEEDDSPFDAAESDDEGAGTADDPASFIDEGALPPLDADGDEGEGLEGIDHVAIDETVIAGTAIERAALDGASLAGERDRWRIASGMGAQVPCWLVAASPVHVVAAGPTVVIARDGARVSKAAGPEIDVVALATAEEAIFAVARKGTLFASVDGGDAWETSSAPWTAMRGVLAIAATPGRLWICDGGSLWSVRWSRSGRPEPPIQSRREGVRAMVAAGSTLLILTEKDRVSDEATSDPEPSDRAPRAFDLAIERLRGDDEAPDVQLLPAPVCEAIGDGPVTLAATADGRALALLAGGAVHVSRDGGASFRRCNLTGVMAIAFAGDGGGARLLALAADERARHGDLILVEAGDPSPTRVADLPGAVAGSGRAALAWDPAREVMWVASSSGLVAYEPSAQH